MYSSHVGVLALLLATITEEVAVWALYFGFSAVLGMVHYTSAIETTSTLPSLGGTYIHCIRVLQSQGLIVVPVLDPAHDKV